MQPLYAYSATVFFTAFATLVAVYGDHWSRTTVVAALLIGAVSQFVAQDPRVGDASNRIAHLAMALSVGALGLFGIGW